MNQLDHLIEVSTAYFVLDSIWIVFNNPWQNRFYLIHHGVTLFLLDEIFQTKDGFLVFLLTISEFSNIANYPIYHLLQSSLQIQKLYCNYLKSLKQIQIILNGSIRVFGYGILAIWFRDLVTNPFLQIALYTIQIMSLIWFVGQLRIYNQEQ